MKVLMFGWEFPPHSSGGLGTACAGLTKGLANQGVKVTFVIPSSTKEMSPSHVNLIIADRTTTKDLLSVTFIDSLLSPYLNPKEYIGKLNLVQERAEVGGKNLYGKDLFQEVYRLSEKAKLIALSDDYDVIHCHDWLTYPAGIKAKNISGKPLIVHIHATEFDRTGGNPNQVIYNMEREGFHEADKIIAVSQFTKDKVVEHYDIPADKVEVIHNAVEFGSVNLEGGSLDFTLSDKVVLFLGRITMQKGPEYFLYSAKRVLEKDPNVKFVVAGTGDMENFMIGKARELGIENNFIFTGFLTGDDIDKAYRMADLYVMPSISEPFGITPLEAMRNGTPCLISKQSGVSEVIDHCLKVDFWDIDQMANKMLGVLNYRDLHQELRDRGTEEVNRFNWDEPASKCISVYHQVK